MESEEIKIGVWEKESKNGNKYYGGATDTHWVTVFDNREWKKNPKSPDFQIIMKEKDKNYKPQEQKKEYKKPRQDTSLQDVPF